ncbi:MAG TPA: hypothetical protein VN229_03730, partial [Terriglobales bacterium]|nr:hypothetical protein [Terriglobales bacterium]
MTVKSVASLSSVLLLISGAAFAEGPACGTSCASDPTSSFGAPVSGSLTLSAGNTDTGTDTGTSPGDTTDDSAGKTVDINGSVGDGAVTGTIHKESDDTTGSKTTDIDGSVGNGA